MRALNRFLPRTKLLSRMETSIGEFFIELDNPTQTFGPGDSVLGYIVLVLRGNATDLTLTLALVGRVKFKFSLVQGRRRVLLFHHTMQIYGPDGSDGPRGLSKGEHRFPFVVQLPTKNIHTLVDFGKGLVLCLLRALLLRSHDPLLPWPLMPLLPAAVPDLAALPGTPASTMLSLGLASSHPPFLVRDRNLSVVVPLNVARLAAPTPKSTLINITAPKQRVRAMSSNATTYLNRLACDDDDLRGQVRLTLLTPQRGYLRGELIPVVLVILRPPTSDFDVPFTRTGVIVTLVRICRLLPGVGQLLTLPQLLDEQSNGTMSPELNNVDLDQTFRKDLAQTVVPLITDFSLGDTVIRAHVLVPEDAFPTISAPGVSFEYLVEGCVNLAGKKLVAGDHGEGENGDGAAPQTLDSHTFMLNTDHVRRIKGIVRLYCNVVIGTERRPVRGNPLPIASTPGSSAPPFALGSSVPALPAEYEPPAPPAPPAVSARSEKEMLRLREQSLLPSAPPTAHVVGTVPSVPSVPTAQFGPFAPQVPLVPLMDAPSNAPLPLSGFPFPSGDISAALSPGDFPPVPAVPAVPTFEFGRRHVLDDAVFDLVPRYSERETD